MEESTREIMGKNGDLVFTEGEEVNLRDQLSQKTTVSKAKSRPLKKRKT